MRLYDPLHKMYYIMLEDGKDYVSVEQPAIYDANAQPFALPAELDIGSLVKLHVEGKCVKAVQVLEYVADKPFSEVRPSQEARDKVAREYPHLVKRASTDEAAAASLWRLAVNREKLWRSDIKLPHGEMPPESWRPVAE